MLSMPVCISLSSLRESIAGRKHFSVLFHMRSMLLHCTIRFLITLHAAYLYLKLLAMSAK